MIMNENEKLKNRVKYLYYEEDLTMKEIAVIVDRSRTRVSAILNEDPNHKMKTNKKRAKRIIQKELNLSEKGSTLIRIPNNLLNAIGVDENNNKVEIKVFNSQIIIKKLNK